MRVGVSGSRTWKDETVIRNALDVALAVSVVGRGEPLVVVHGKAKRGADWIAHEWVEAMKGAGALVTEDPFPPDRRKHGDRCYYVRNLAMVRSDTDLFLFFIHNDSAGATQTLNLARTYAVKRRVYRRWGDDWSVPITIGEERPIRGLERVADATAGQD